MVGLPSFFILMGHTERNLVMKRTFENILKKSKETAKRNDKIRSLREQRDKINDEIYSLKALNEAMLYTSTIEEAEQIILPFSKRFPETPLTPETNFKIDLQMSGEEIKELYERIQDFHGITLPSETNIETYSELINVIDQISNALYGEQT